MAVNTELHPTLENLDPKLVFARFGDLARKRESLYSDFIEIDEPEEIGNAWVSFSSVVVNDLLSVINLTKSLFERLVDELRRSNEEPEPSDLNRIQKLTEFWLDLSVIAYLYATVEKRGVLNQPGTGTNSLGYIEAKKSIDQLILLAFQAGQEFFSIDARITLGEVLALDQEKKRLDYLEILSEEENDMKNKILGSYDYNQTRFLMTRLQKRMINSALSWWWSDAISMHSLAEHALSHLDSCKNYWSKCSSDLFEKGLVFHQQQFPIIKIYSSVSLAQHFRRLGLAALKVRGNAVASEYFYQAAELTASMGMENLGIVEKIELWEPSIPEQYLIYTQMSYLSTISSKYHSILRYIKDNKIDEIKILVPEILENISRILSFGDLAYVSSVAVAYETVFSYISEEIEKEKPDTENIVKFVEKRMNTVGDRLHKASHQITSNWVKVILRDPSNIIALKEIVLNIDYPLMAIFILPPDSKIVEPASSELMAVKLVSHSLELSSLAEKEFGNNPVKEMLIRAKTFELVNEAKGLLSGIQNEETVYAIKEVIIPLIKTSLLRGLIAEVQLRTSVLQYQFINRIAPLVENSSLGVQQHQRSVPFDQTELDNFKTELLSLNIASKSIQKYKTPISIGGAPLNWQYIVKIDYFSSGLIEVVNSIIYAIQASSTNKDEIEDAIQAWDEAKTIAYAAAENIAKAGVQDSENLSQQVYSLAQVYSRFENKSRDRKDPGLFPVQGIVELLQAMVMAL